MEAARRRVNSGTAAADLQRCLEGLIGGSRTPHEHTTSRDLILDHEKFRDVTCLTKTLLMVSRMRYGRNNERDTCQILFQKFTEYFEKMPRRAMLHSNAPFSKTCSMRVFKHFCLDSFIYADRRVLSYFKKFPRGEQQSQGASAP